MVEEKGISTCEELLINDRFNGLNGGSKVEIRFFKIITHTFSVYILLLVQE